MQRFMDKWGLWAAFVVVGSIIAYGLITGLMKAEPEPPAKNAASKAARRASSGLTRRETIEPRPTAELPSPGRAVSLRPA